MCDLNNLLQSQWETLARKSHITYILHNVMLNAHGVVVWVEGLCESHCKLWCTPKQLVWHRTTSPCKLSRPALPHLRGWPLMINLCMCSSHRSMKGEFDESQRYHNGDDVNCKLRIVQRYLICYPKSTMPMGVHVHHSLVQFSVQHDHAPTQVSEHLSVWPVLQVYIGVWRLPGQHLDKTPMHTL